MNHTSNIFLKDCITFLAIILVYKRIFEPYFIFNMKLKTHKDVKVRWHVIDHISKIHWDNSQSLYEKLYI